MNRRFKAGDRVKLSPAGLQQKYESLRPDTTYTVSRYVWDNLIEIKELSDLGAGTVAVWFDWRFELASFTLEEAITRLKEAF